VGKLLGRILLQDTLVFDIGAHQGSKCDRFLGYGTRVICVESLPEFAKSLRTRYAQNPRVRVLNFAAGERAGSE